MTTWEESLKPYPGLQLANAHCDNRILHAPSSCTYCDHYPALQELRVKLGINFTEEHDPNKLPCPADAARGDTLNLWPGNIAMNAEREKEISNYAIALEEAIHKELDGTEIIEE